ncbi:PEP-CTERM sorting domain-containing protein [Luteolibacter yonseiensis]|uniref:PEP-CTERM sorting domain-containing protein n=1 Tax=Luteolibacter yonseiensis TaxID=1144680 RepID=A0A934R0P1_9BACT|nr:PEP-CTERM sorting domain-containing protein [Luteolibacter yonseiensis]MBK1814322.1 PEP-CTERM sorting domain-containing protein [Luteolibacter yonseiensis]
MKYKIAFPGRLASWLGIMSVLCLSLPASAATLILRDWASLPFPPDATHADRYPFPNEFTLSETNPITQIEMDYRNLPNIPGVGIHEIKSAAFLFAPADVASTTIFENTAERFWARIVFRTAGGDRRLTGLNDPSAPSFVAFHGSAAGGANTSTKWTVTYLNGATAVYDNGIVPEPGTMAVVAISAVLGLSCRRRHVTGATA